MNIKSEKLRSKICHAKTNQPAPLASSFHNLRQNVNNIAYSRAASHRHRRWFQSSEFHLAAHHSKPRGFRKTHLLAIEADDDDDVDGKGPTSYIRYTVVEQASG